MNPRPLDYGRSSSFSTRALLARLALAWGLASGVAVAASVLGGWVSG